MATAAQVAQYRSLNADLVTLAQTSLTDFWSALDVFGNPLLVRDALLEFFPELVQAYGDTSAVLAADFYDEIRGEKPSATPFAAILANPPARPQSEAAVRWGITELFQPEPNPPQSLKNLSGALQRLVLEAGRTTTIESAKRDPRRTGFARIPQGKTCRWCTMLASRGFVYGSEKSAGAFNDWHDDCDCIVVPGDTNRDLPSGYDLAEMVRLNAEGVGIGRTN